MKQIILISFVLFGLIGYSQTDSKTIPAKPNANSIVKDVNGNLYTYDIWNSLVKSRDYIVVAGDSVNGQREFILKKLTEEQKSRRDMRYPKPPVSNFFKTGEKMTSFRTTDINNNKIDFEGIRREGCCT
jgi:hypothetical protein